MTPRSGSAVLAYALLAAAGLTSFMLPETLNVPTMLASGPPDRIVMRGVVRDFQPSHVDFDVLPTNGAGHYAATIASRLGSNRRPIQVEAIDTFTVNGGRVLPTRQFAAKATVLGAAMTGGGDGPITMRFAADVEAVTPFGDFEDASGGNVNDGANPREHIFPLDHTYSPATPITLEARSWTTTGGGAPGNVGFETIFTMGAYSNAYDKQIGIKVQMPTPGVVHTIRAYLNGNGTQPVRFAIYTDNAGEPGALITETTSVLIPNGWSWVSIPTDPTYLAAGDHWLGLALFPGVQFKAQWPMGEFRYADHDAANGNFLPSWGTPSFSTQRELSMYAMYTEAGGSVPHITAISNGTSPNARVLTDGDPVPTHPRFTDPAQIPAYLADYVDPVTDLATLDANAVLYLFELGTTDLGSPDADFQDLVVHMALGSDPLFFVEGSSSESGLGYRVDAQWRNASSIPVPPHLFRSADGDVAGVAGPSDRGGIDSPQTFDEWFCDILGVNQSVVHDLELVRNASGAYEYVNKEFFPLDDRAFGNGAFTHNLYFTATYTGSFVYRASGGQFVELMGGDGAWIFIDERLAVDLGGVGTSVTQRAWLDRLDLVDGQTYLLRLYYAHRRGPNASLQFRTNAELIDHRSPRSVSAQFD